MSDERNLGVTQVGLGLTLLTCLLVALGYFVLQRLGGSTESPPVVRGPASIREPPQILTVQGSEPSSGPYPQTTLRPIWLAPQQDPADARLQRFDPAASENDVVEPSLFDAQPIESRQFPNDPTRY
jgi:hypothetical protein